MHKRLFWLTITILRLMVHIISPSPSWTSSPWTVIHSKWIKSDKQSSIRDYGPWRQPWSSMYQAMLQKPRIPIQIQSPFQIRMLGLGTQHAAREDFMRLDRNQEFMDTLSRTRLSICPSVFGKSVWYFEESNSTWFIVFAFQWQQCERIKLSSTKSDSKERRERPTSLGSIRFQFRWRNLCWTKNHWRIQRA